MLAAGLILIMLVFVLAIADGDGRHRRNPALFVLAGVMLWTGSGLVVASFIVWAWGAMP